MADTMVFEKIDLAASTASIAFAREFAALQAGVVHRTVGRSDDLSVDLLFLAQESVLVFEETHRLVSANAADNFAAPMPAFQLSEHLRTLKAATTSRQKRARLVLLGLTAFVLFALMIDFLCFGAAARLGDVATDSLLGRF